MFKRSRKGSGKVKVRINELVTTCREERRFVPVKKRSLGLMHAKQVISYFPHFCVNGSLLQNFVWLLESKEEEGCGIVIAPSSINTVTTCTR